MSGDTDGKWYYLLGGQPAIGGFSTWQEAVLEGTQDQEDLASIEVGMDRPPLAAEGYIDAEFILNHICNQEEYDIDWGESGWPNATKEQEAELTEQIQAVVGAWLDRHSLRPTWVIVDDIHRRTKREALGESEPC